MNSPEIPLNSVAGQHVDMPAALACYLSSILEIARTIEAIAPEIASSFREPLMSLGSQLSADPTPDELEQSREALLEILQSFCERARHENQTLARDLKQTLTMV